MRYILLILFLFPTFAQATPCQGPSVDTGWGASFPTGKTVKGFMYDLGNSILYPNFPDITYAIFTNVPYGTAQAFANTQTPDTFYANQIYPIYHEALQAENCPAILTEAGGIILVR